VRNAVKDLTEDSRDAISLFESSAPEPVELLREVVAKSFSQPITTRYRSVFSESNPYIVAALSKRYGLAPDSILCTTGATGAISLLYKTFLNRGDHVLVETPGFDIFADFALSQGAEADVFMRAAPDFAIDPAAIARKIKPRTRFIVLSNLHNPSGAFVPDETLLALADLAAARGVMVIVDEVYRDYAGGAAIKDVGAKLRQNVISVSSLTKIYGLSTLRCGWIVAAPKILDAVRIVSDKFEFNVSKLAHAVAAEVLEGGAEFDRYTSDILAAARPVMADALAAMSADELLAGAMPEYGCICFPRVVGVTDTHRLSRWLIANHGLYVVPGEYFGAPGYFRLGFALEPAQLARGLEKLAHGLAEYAGAARAKSFAG
jgi:aspartate/methionine/tyrosine aminotransferase